MPIFATSNVKQDKIMEMKQQKTTKAMSAMLNDIDNDILEQMRNVRSEQDMLYNKQYNAIAQMCEEMQERYLYVNFKKITEFTDEEYITGLIKKYVFMDNVKAGQPRYKITELEYHRNDTISITLRGNVDDHEFEYVFAEMNGYYPYLDELDYKWIDNLYKLMTHFVEYYQPAKKWVNRND